MYPYFYPSYFNQPATGAATPMAPAPTQPVGQELPPVPGKTAGMPVEPTTPAPVTMQPPQVDFEQEPGAPVMTDVEYTQGYLRTQIGKHVRIEFLIGTNMTTDRMGTLMDVGISYVIIRPTGTDDRMLCDIYSIKFVTFFD